MSDTAVRPMTAADYLQGQPVPVVAVGGHPIRDLVLAAVVGAAALWAVPKALDYAADRGLLGPFGGDLDDDDDGLTRE